MNELKHDLYMIFVDHFTLKAAFSFFAMVASWTFGNEYHAVIAIISLRSIDFITGTIAAIKTKKPDMPNCIWGSWTSEKATAGIKKTGMYALLILVSRLVDKALPIHAWAPLIDSYIAITEGGSILENIRKLGYDIPTILVTKLLSKKQ